MKMKDSLLVLKKIAELLLFVDRIECLFCFDMVTYARDKTRDLEIERIHIIFI